MTRYGDSSPRPMSATSESAEITLAGAAFCPEGTCTLRRNKAVPNQPGYSPPAVDFELQDGTINSVVVSESDIPLLHDDDIEKAKRNLSLILDARQGDLKAVTELRSAAQESSVEEAKPSSTLRKPFRGSLYELSVPHRASHQPKSLHTPKAVPTRLSSARVCGAYCAGLRRSRSAL